MAAASKGDARCPVCRGPSHRATAGKVFPFCGPRCWAVDLGKWLGEEYRVASDDAPPVPDRDHD